MKKWKYIITHHNGLNWGNALFIDKMHRRRDWLGIGYHFVILNGVSNYEDHKKGRSFDSLVGNIECGRPLNADLWVATNEIGAHALGLNENSIGICLIHRDGTYDIRMIASLLLLLKELCFKYQIPVENVKGHYEVDDKKPLCPGIDMVAIRRILKASGGEYAQRETLWQAGRSTVKGF